MNTKLKINNTIKDVKITVQLFMMVKSFRDIRRHRNIIGELFMELEEFYKQVGGNFEDVKEDYLMKNLLENLY